MKTNDDMHGGQLGPDFEASLQRHFDDDSDSDDDCHLTDRSHFRHDVSPDLPTHTFYPTPSQVKACKP